MDIINSNFGSSSSPPNMTFNAISWGPIFAGVFVALLVYLALSALGLAIGGSKLAGIAEGTNTLGGLGTGTAAWTVIVGVISLFVGGLSASRVGGAIPIRIGVIQGIVIAGLFFGVLMMQLGSAVGFLGRGVGAVLGSAGNLASGLVQSPQVQDMVGSGLNGLNLQSPPGTVAQGVASRLMQGDTEGAKNYLAAQAGISPDEADAKIQAIRPQLEAALQKAGETAASVVKGFGWFAFFATVLGGIAGAVGGGLGAARNLRAPVSKYDEEAIVHRKSA